MFWLIYFRRSKRLWGFTESHWYSPGRNVWQKIERISFQARCSSTWCVEKL